MGEQGARSYHSSKLSELSRMAQSSRIRSGIAGKLPAERLQFVSHDTTMPHVAGAVVGVTMPHSPPSDVQVAHLAAVVFNEPPAGGHLQRAP